MAKQRAGRRKRTHAGIKVLTLKDGRHVARWRDPMSGQQVQKSLDKLGLTNDEARRKWAREKSGAVLDLRRAVSLGAVASTRTGVRAAVKDYLEGVAHGATRESKQVPLRTLADRLDAAGVASLADLAGPTLMAVRDWVTSPRRQHQASTKNRHLAVIGSFLRWARRRGLAPLLTLEAIADSCARIPEPVEPIEFLQPAEIRQVLEAAIAHDADKPGRQVAPFLLALLLSGCRLQEVGELTWGEIHDDGIHLPAERVKTRRARVVTFAESPALRTLLEALRPTDAKPGDRVFPLSVQWEATLKVLLAKPYEAPAFTAHTLRRTCGTVLTNAAGIHGGASAWHSAKRLGHSVEQAERDYAGRLTGLPQTATTFEAAAGIGDLCAKIVKAAAVASAT